jgi:hypothetical protein
MNTLLLLSVLGLTPVSPMYDRAQLDLSGGGTIGGPLVLTGPLSLPDGTAATPSWAWASDADGSGTGAYRSAADTIAFVTNSGLRFSLDSGGADLRVRLYHATLALNLGTGAATSHALGTGAVLAGGALEVDGRIYADDNIQLANDGFITGDSTSAKVALRWLSQTPDGAMLFTGSANGNNSWILSEYDDRTYDRAWPLQTNPTIVGYSANQSQTEYWSLAHDQSKAVLATGDANGAIALQNVKGAYSVMAADAPVTVTFSGGGGDATQTATNFRVAQRKILGVSGRVVTTGTTCAGMDIGDGADDDRYGSDIAITDGTVFDIDDAIADPEEFLTTAGDVVITGTNGAGVAANCVDLVVNLTLHWRGYQAATVD